MFLPMNFGMNVLSKQMPKIIQPLEKIYYLNHNFFSNSLRISLFSDYLTKLRLERLKNIKRGGRWHYSVPHPNPDPGYGVAHSASLLALLELLADYWKKVAIMLDSTELVKNEWVVNRTNSLFVFADLSHTWYFVSSTYLYLWE